MAEYMKMIKSVIQSMDKIDYELKNIQNAVFDFCQKYEKEIPFNTQNTDDCEYIIKDLTDTE